MPKSARWNLQSTVALIATGWCGHWDGEEDIIPLSPAVLVNNSCSAERNSTLKQHNYDYHGLAKLQHARTVWKNAAPFRNIKKKRSMTVNFRNMEAQKKSDTFYCVGLVEINNVHEMVQFRKHDS